MFNDQHHLRNLSVYRSSSTKVLKYLSFIKINIKMKVRVL